MVRGVRNRGSQNPTFDTPVVGAFGRKYPAFPLGYLTKSLGLDSHLSSVVLVPRITDFKIPWTIRGHSAKAKPPDLCLGAILCLKTGAGEGS
jgi:hypothetical protein